MSYPFEILTQFCPVFECVWYSNVQYSNVQYSDVQCIRMSGIRMFAVYPNLINDPISVFFLNPTANWRAAYFNNVSS